ncbi:hypothetical protein WJ542_07295 [Paraburkholderia sp. B3]|uniref:hypothetical protein n=1 Tax=Paraburkholderia sp. B3 TaxID=3134791 RepID=UPI0039825FA0
MSGFGSLTLAEYGGKALVLMDPPMSHQVLFVGALVLAYGLQRLVLKGIAIYTWNIFVKRALSGERR